MKKKKLSILDSPSLCNVQHGKCVMHSHPHPRHAVRHPPVMHTATLPVMTLCLSRTVITLTLCKSGCQFLVLLSCSCTYRGGPCMAQPCPQYASINHSVNVTAYTPQGQCMGSGRSM
jgi:hypothetical protein